MKSTLDVAVAGMTPVADMSRNDPIELLNALCERLALVGGAV